MSHLWENRVKRLIVSVLGCPTWSKKWDKIGAKWDTLGQQWDSLKH